jgi:hypothetical protein
MKDKTDSELAEKLREKILDKMPPGTFQEKPHDQI